jgi:hypothetical protein
MSRGKRYFVSFVGEAVMNPRFSGYAGGRVEVFDQESPDGYACEEIRFFTKKPEFDKLRDKHDMEYKTELGLARLRREIAAKYRDKP